MTRTTKKALRHVGLYLGVLFSIIYLTTPTEPSKALAWNMIRYKTTSGKLPEVRGTCPGLKDTAKPVLVVSRVSKDHTNWLDKLSSRYHICIYTADAPPDTHSNELQVPKNRGHEAMGYLTFLIDNYDNIPKAGAVFIHGSRWAWHNDHPEYDNAVLLADLNISRAVEQFGYHNMKCDWTLSTCDLSLKPQGSLENSIQAKLVPWDKRAKSDAALPGALEKIFGKSKKGELTSKLGRSDALRSQCCAQFAVSRESLWQHEKTEYVALRQWLLDGEGAPKDDLVAGRILSYVWHVLFIRKEAEGGIELEELNKRACPLADECYCRLYGKCDLKGCTSGRCDGQYSEPYRLKLPADWAATHS